jgi:hypothetical protein
MEPKMNIQEEFRRWMINKKKVKRKSTANSYAKAINNISKYYSENEDKFVDIYKIRELSSLRKIEKDISTGGKYEVFGKLNHNINTAGLGKYIEFVAVMELNDEKENMEIVEDKIESNMKKEFEKWMTERGGKESSTALHYKSAINAVSRHYSQQTNKNIDLYINK